jgi:hypothetical protein
MMRTQCSLSRAYSKACNDLERIQAARQKQEEPSEPVQAENPRRFTVSFVNPETGESRIIDRVQDGKLVKEFIYDDELKPMAEGAPPTPRRPRSTGNGAFQPSGAVPRGIK